MDDELIDFAVGERTRYDDNMEKIRWMTMTSPCPSLYLSPFPTQFQRFMYLVISRKSQAYH